MIAKFASLPEVGLNYALSADGRRLFNIFVIVRETWISQGQNTVESYQSKSS